MNIEIIPVTAFQQNCSLIWDDNHNAAIIDPGGESEKLIARIKTFKLNLKSVLITHAHLDHVGAAVAIKEHFNVPIWGSNSQDKPLFEMLPVQSQMFGCELINAFLPDRWLDEDEIIEIGDMQFQVKFLPGHAPGHIGFFNLAQKIAFTGDVLFNGGIGRTDLQGGDYNILMQTIKHKLMPLADDLVIIPGHGPHTTIGQERATNPFLNP